MHEICYGFCWSIKKWSNWGEKAGFLAHFESFFVYALLHPMSCAPRFCQMKDLSKIYICGKFHQYSICGCEVKKFKVFRIDSALMKWSRFGGFEPLLQILVDLAEILTRGNLSIREIQRLKNSSRFWILVQMEHTQSLQFWSIFRAQFTVGKPKILLKTIFLQKTAPLGISNNARPSSQNNHRILVKLSKKKIFLAQIRCKLPVGPRQSVIS